MTKNDDFLAALALKRPDLVPGATKPPYNPADVFEPGSILDRPRLQTTEPVGGFIGALEEIAKVPMFKKMLGGVEDKPSRVQDRYVRNLKATGIWVPLALLLTGLVIAFLIILANLTPLIIAMISKWMV